MSKSKALDLLRATQRALKGKGWTERIDNLKFVSANDGSCVAEFTVGQEHLNAFGTLHGGCTSTLIDYISTGALITTGRPPSVTIDLHVTLLKAVYPGDVVTIDAKTIKAGRTLAFLAVEISKSDGVVVARGSHTVFIGQS